MDKKTDQQLIDEFITKGGQIKKYGNKGYDPYKYKKIGDKYAQRTIGDICQQDDFGKKLSPLNPLIFSPKFKQSRKNHQK